jgi:hypothetical protein
LAALSDIKINYLQLDRTPEDDIEAALLDPEPAFQGLNHLPVGMRIFQMHVERGRIGGADSFKSSVAAPEFHAAFEVRVENPHVISPPKAPKWSQLSPEAILLQGGRIRARRGRRANVMMYKP